MVTTTIHKTLGGGRGGMILCREEYAKKIDSRVFPGHQGGPLMHMIAGKAVTLKIAQSDLFRERQRRTREGAAIVAEEMVAAGVNVLTGGTDVHLVLADLRESELDGQQAEDRLHEIGITVNRNAVPFDPRPPAVSSGLRIGTPALATRGFQADDFREVGRVIGEALTGDFSDADRSELTERTRALAEQAPALPAAGRARGRVDIFELEGIGLERDGRPVLRDVTLSIRPGSTALVGPSGSGKSTLLRLLNRLADPDEGVVRFHGTDVRELNPLDLRRRVGLVPQLPAPVPGSVGDNVSFGPRLHGEEVDPERPVRLAGLDSSFLERDASRLSVGEQQRVMLARALALEPEVLLLDEPTASLDPAATAAVEDALRNLHEVSLVLVTHDRGQAERLAQRTVELDGGRVTR